MAIESASRAVESRPEPEVISLRANGVALAIAAAITTEKSRCVMAKLGLQDGDCRILAGKFGESISVARQEGSYIWSIDYCNAEGDHITDTLGISYTNNTFANFVITSEADDPFNRAGPSRKKVYSKNSKTMGNRAACKKLAGFRRAMERISKDQRN